MIRQTGGLSWFWSRGWRQHLQSLPAAGAARRSPTTLLPPPPSLWPLSVSQVGSLPSRPTWATRHLLSSAAQVQRGIPAASSWASQDLGANNPYQRDVLGALPGFHCASSTSEPPHLGVGGFPGNEPRCQCRRYERLGFDPWVGKTPGGGHGIPLQQSCLENPTDRGAWQATVRGVAQSQAELKQPSTH